MRVYKTGVIALGMGGAWAKAAHSLENTELTMVYDPNFEKNPRIEKEFYKNNGAIIAESENEIYKAGLDIIVVASPDHFHVAQSVKALKSGAHVVCEKPLAPTVADCKKIIKAVSQSGKFFMTGQVCRYAPGFILAKRLVDEKRIGKIAFIESEYAHDYTYAVGYNNWRKDPKIKREGMIGGGCHAMDLVRWLVGNPEEVCCYTNRILLAKNVWPTADTGVIIGKFPNNVIGKMFVSVGVKRPYTMRTVICGTEGTIICDNTNRYIRIFEQKNIKETGLSFTKIPVNIASHNVTDELREFVSYLDKNKQSPTDVYEGTRTVAFGEAALRSAREGKPVRVEKI
ncbi:MAG: Gfo/Idh/MocA family oxidoreductase [Kiritimatiellia bacterium]|nr:Gfo/Idh/MocA family oxidoreductase [Kiritimatiellia bacterium]